MNKYDKLSMFIGWGVFIISLATYTLTLEPTASLWDCGEFIATSYKLEVGHPPGTPLFFLINRIGALFASDTSTVAYAINFLSGLESALTILFMFWSIVMLGHMLYRGSPRGGEDKTEWGILLAAAIGSLSYAFTDTFWFSAVEAEVYALSSLFTAVVVWAMLKWERIADEPKSDRWLILISYFMGLSIGAHILNLLTIPALTFIYFFKRFPGRTTIKQLIPPTIIGMVLTGVFYLLTPTVVGIGAFVDRFFVNVLSLPVNFGLAFFVILVLVFLYYEIRKSSVSPTNKSRLVNIICTSIAMVIIGFSSYTVVLVRSSVNPPMNSNQPSDPYALKAFLNREQYGSRPLIYGQTYASTVLPTDRKNFETSYQLIKETSVRNGDTTLNIAYKPYQKLTGYNYSPNTEMFFPRMYSSSGNHVKEYKKWIGYTNNGNNKHIVRSVITDDGNQKQKVEIPTFWSNIKFFVLYQMNHMYWRYFLWNFVGRQSDIQCSGGIDNGQWMSGVRFIDELYLGPQDNLPHEIASNKGRNTYFFLPLILGLIGLFFQLKRDGRGFSIVMLLFFMTGIAIILYLNQTPLQPRERDYAYAGSFYAFAIWIGLGVLCVQEFLEKYIKSWKPALAVTAVLVLSVPAILAQQNWDDHDRSGRTVARDMGFNYLNSTLPNSVIVNYGDNDTFPVWYAQEVEGVRTDVKVMNASYIQGGWYIKQMKMKSNESEPIPFSLPEKKYREGAMLQFPVYDVPHPGGGVWTAKDVMTWVSSDDPKTKYPSGGSVDYDFVPSSHIALPVNKENAIASGIIKEKDLPLVEDTIYIDLKDDVITIDQLMMIDMFAHFEWKRPLFFTSFGGLIDFGLVGISNDNHYTYLQNDGFAYHLVPIKSPIESYEAIGRIDTDDLYNKMMNVFRYGNISDPNTYIDSFIDYTVSVSRIRANFALLSSTLSKEGKNDKAIEVLDKLMDVIPVSKVRYDDAIITVCEAYWKAGANEKGDLLAENYIANLKEYLDYYTRFKGAKWVYIQPVAESYIKQLYNILVSSYDCKRVDVQKRHQEYFNNIYSKFQ